MYEDSIQGLEGRSPSLIAFSHSVWDWNGVIVREQKARFNQHSTKGARVYHKLEVDNCIRRLQHAHLDGATAWPDATLREQQSVGKWTGCLADGIDHVKQCYSRLNDYKSS